MTASFGFQADVRALQKVLAARNLIHQHQHNKQMSCPGKGCVFTYDVVGSHERVGYSSQGSGSTLIMPFVDNQLKSPSPLLSPAQWLCCGSKIFIA
ncbi:proteasome subunit beta type-1-like isoform X5 [Camellia sinensis]|uniref:proteasome subunit beta type-1-like isoform X5 n=1 Tax=Camellia sinensis TaxID=4442 RepID=UPI00103639A5|nr:proteasome subunit beta type-1-like isoform X5 [Camellia sinensis]